MLITHKTIISIFVCMFFMSACSTPPEVIDGKYSLDECKKELLEAEDYNGNDEGIDLIVVEKKKHTMYLYKGDKLQNTIPVSLGKNPIGPKEKRGDGKTPEGTFWISRKLCSSKYYRSLCISYPREEDRKRASAKGLDPGSDITIHAQPPWNADGRGNGYTLAHDWTEGCVAVTDDVMSQLWYAVREGVPIVIK